MKGLNNHNQSLNLLGEQIKLFWLDLRSLIYRRMRCRRWNLEREQSGADFRLLDMFEAPWLIILVITAQALPLAPEMLWFKFGLGVTTPEESREPLVVGRRRRGPPPA